MARRLVIMGSGETTPGMLGVHRDVFAALPDPPAALLLDSPFAFQENADELVERIGGYFAESLGRVVRRVSLAAGADELAVERALSEIRAAEWVFAGPGSPSYARRCWAGTPIPEALADVVAPGRTGALVFASAAAVTLGDWSLPVYEIYKVGADPRWEPGIGLMDRIMGWRCSVVPHYDNKEGGTHDTRFCYVGGRRLARIEPELDSAFILGVDEHTAFALDLDAGLARVAGRGGVTLRVAGREHVLPSGTSLTIAQVEETIAGLGAPGAVLGGGLRLADASPASPAAARAAGATPAPDAGAGDPPHPPRRPDLARVPTEAADVAPVNSQTDAAGPTGAGSTADPAGPTGAGSTADPADLARLVLAALPADAATSRAALVDLAARAEAASLEHSRDVAGRIVQLLVDERSARRVAGDWAASDRLRDALAAVGVEVRDTREGSTWLWA